MLVTERSVAILVHHALKQGGLENTARRAAAAFSARGCQVSLVTFAPTSTKSERISYESLGVGLPSSLLKLWQFDWRSHRVFQKKPRDIIFGFDRVRHQTHLRAGNGVHAAYLQQRALTDRWIKRITDSLHPFHRSLLHFERQAFENPSLRRLFTNSHMVRNEILHHYRVEPDKISVVHNGVDWASSQQLFDRWPEGRAQLLADCHLPSSAFYFLFVGHGYRRKGLEFLLHGLARIQDPHVHLLVVGRERRPATFRALTARLGLDKRTHFLGARSDVWHLYQAADALVVPSIYDPFANVTVEGLAMGLYTISSRHNGGHEVLTPATGTTISTLDDPDAVAEALQRAIARPKKHNSAEVIRDSIRALDSARQLDQMVTLTLKDL